MIVIDTREKKFEHITTFFNQHGIEYELLKLDVGDYQNTDKPDVVVDRKANLQEICTNLSKGKENHSRFVKECKRAFDSKIKLIVLIEGANYEKLNDIKEWKSKYTAYTGRWLVEEMFKLTMAYGVEWQLCGRNQTPKRILEVLEYDGLHND